MPIRAGELRERVTFEEFLDTQDATGGVSKTWTAVSGLEDIPARVVSSKGAESMAAAREGATRTIKFKMRYFSGVTPAMRVVWNGDVFDVFDVDDSLRQDGELWVTGTAAVD